jgi:hypothetical protein
VLFTLTRFKHRKLITIDLKGEQVDIYGHLRDVLLDNETSILALVLRQSLRSQ